MRNLRETPAAAAKERARELLDVVRSLAEAGPPAQVLGEPTRVRTPEFLRRVLPR